MVDMTQGVQAADPTSPCDLDHGTQRLCREAPAPRILGQYITGCRPIRRLECESRPTNQSAVVARKGEVRADGPLAPLLIAEGKKRPRLIQRDMYGPGEISRHV
jgi:hypothetical protein